MRVLWPRLLWQLTLQRLTRTEKDPVPNLPEHREEGSPTNKKRRLRKNAQRRQQGRLQKNPTPRQTKVVQLLLNSTSPHSIFELERLSRRGNTNRPTNCPARRLILARRVV